MTNDPKESKNYERESKESKNYERESKESKNYERESKETERKLKGMQGYSDVKIARTAIRT